MNPEKSEEADEPKLVLRLPNAMSSVEDSRIAVTEFLQPFGIGTPVMNRVEVILEELVSNLVRHAQGVRAVGVTAGYSDDAISLVVEDDGAEFNPFELPEPEPSTTLADAKLGGLGVPLVRRLSSSTSYERVGSGALARNRVSVTIANA